MQLSLQKNRSPENLRALQNLIEHDILGSIESNLSHENISVNDAYKLKRLTKHLYDYIYAHYDEMKELNEMTDESLLLDIDIIEMKYEKALAEKEAALAKIISALKEKDSVLTETSFALSKINSVLAEKDSALAEKNSALAEKDSALAEKDSALAEKDLEIERLKAEIAKLKHR